jgi:hypothetical protein
LRVIERFRGKPVSGFKGEAALNVLPIQADQLRVTTAFFPARSPGFGRHKVLRGEQQKAKPAFGRVDRTEAPTADLVFEKALDEILGVLGRVAPPSSKAIDRGLGAVAGVGSGVGGPVRPA